MQFTTVTTIRLPDASGVINQVCAHLLEHHAEVENNDDKKVVRYQGSSAHISILENEANINVSADTLDALYLMRTAIASHIYEFAADEKPTIRWSGDGQDLLTPPNFSVLKVRSIRNVTPHMRRITLAGAVGRFDQLEALHVNLVIPHPDGPPHPWPQLGPDGLIVWPKTEFLPARRKYTVRHVDKAVGTIDIDFVLHEAEGPGSTFARQATVGQQIGMFGPGGGGLQSADWYLFAGDETALPAIARMIESLPARARGKAIIEVASQNEIQEIVTAAAVEISWLCRDGAGSLNVETDALSKAVMKETFPSDGSTIYVWVGCEHEEFKRIRNYMRREQSLNKDQSLVVSYWRREQKE